MSFPFGGHPTLAEYLEWACREEQCSVKTGIVADDLGAAVSTVLVENAKNGKHVIVAGVQQTEYILPTFINYLDRRLGIKSAFVSFDGDAD